ncbi:hypothetical protein W97_03316 [Coniosporium apollinis CBS 100218]|uniref:Uncharacterized protein n=1 Tax=Coniosporium apollinis (strain CBS 100218) TaxID=1168221 RepID=R7YR43_CONA1|nr:uncharacterized protein W97_03316 [Coniosporium apollinis CBS 100218]EON64086.1 hypothetical protein W97_03316 [Coniosporium apollinis CBS 100218]
MQKPAYPGFQLSRPPARLATELYNLSTLVQTPTRSVEGRKHTPWAIDPQVFQDIHVLSFRASVFNARLFLFQAEAPTVPIVPVKLTSAIMVSAGSMPVRCGVLFHEPGKLIFLLSQAYEYTFVLLSGCESGGVAPEFHYDEEHFPTRPWSILNVMLILRYAGEAQRMAIEQMHEDAWELACPKKEDVLVY